MKRVTNHCSDMSGMVKRLRLFTWAISTLGNLALKSSTTCSPSGAPPQPSIRSELRSYLFTSSDLARATTSGGGTGIIEILYLSTALSIPSKSNLCIRTSVSPIAMDLTSTTNPNTWNSGSVNSDTGCGSALSESCRIFLRWQNPPMSAMRFRCESNTPFTRPVVPEEKRIAAESD